MSQENPGKTKNDVIQDKELEEVIERITKISKAVKQNPARVGMLCIETGFEIFNRLETVVKESAKKKVVEFLNEL